MVRLAVMFFHTPMLVLSVRGKDSAIAGVGQQLVGVLWGSDWVRKWVFNMLMLRKSMPPGDKSGSGKALK